LTVPIRRTLAALATSVALLMAAGEATAQVCFDPTSSRQAVYFTGPDNDISCVLDFETGSSRQVANSGGSLFKGIYVLYEGEGAGLSLVAASSTQGGDIQVFGCDANGESCAKRGVAAVFSQVSGVALDTYGNLAAVNNSRILYAPRCTPGDTSCASQGFDPAAGYGAVVGPLAVPGMSQLVDVRFVSNAIETSTLAGAKYQPGDVLVLGPSEVRALHASDLAGGSLGSPVLVASLPGGYQATGFALFPKTGELLVTTNQGRILVYDRTGTSQGPDFVSSTGGQAVNAAIGNTNPTSPDPASSSEVFITATNNGRVIKYTATRQGGALVAATGSAQMVTTGNPPYGVGNATLTDAAWTGTGAGVTVVPAVGHELTFNNVSTPGFSESRVYLIEKTAGWTGAITGDMVGLPSTFSRSVPSHIECIPRTGGGCYYLVYVAESTAGFFGSTQKHVIEDEEFGLTATCGAVFDEQPRLFYAPDDPQTEIVEGGLLTPAADRQGFIDISTGCGSHIGRGAQFSLFLSGRDLRAVSEIATAKLAALQLALTATDATQGGLAPFVPKKIRKTLTNAISKAISADAKGDVAGARSYLASIVSTVQENVSGFPATAGGVTRNAAGEIIARAESAGFTVCGATTACNVDSHD